jgi:hypothetical protein
MTASTIAVAPMPPTGRAKPILYVRSMVAVAMIVSWVAAASSGITVWLAADGRGAGELPWLLGASKHTWGDLHVVASFVALALTLTHLTVMRRGVLAYGRLLLTGRRNATANGARRPRSVVYLRAMVIVAMVGVVSIVVVSGIVPWLAAEGPGMGRRLLLLDVTKRGWTDIHTAIATGAILLTAAHVAMSRTGLAADVRLLITGQRSRRRRIGPGAPSADRP